MAPRAALLLACLLGVMAIQVYADDPVAEEQTIFPRPGPNTKPWSGAWAQELSGSAVRTVALRIAITADAGVKRVWRNGEVTLNAECSAACCGYDMNLWFNVTAPAATSRWVGICWEEDPQDPGDYDLREYFPFATGDRCRVTGNAFIQLDPGAVDNAGSADRTIYGSIAATDGRWVAVDQSSMYWVVEGTTATTCYFIGQLQYVPAATGPVWMGAPANPWAWLGRPSNGKVTRVNGRSIKPKK